MKLYHVTPIKNVPMILKHGLKPGRRRGFTRKVDVDPQLRAGRYLYFVDGLEEVGDLATALSSYQYSPTGLAILEVEVPDTYPFILESDVDPNASGIYAEFLVSNRSVPPQSIKVLGTIKSGYQRGQGWGLSPKAIPKSIDLPGSLMKRVDFGARRAAHAAEYHGGPEPEEFKVPYQEKEYSRKLEPEIFGLDSWESKEGLKGD